MSKQDFPFQSGSSFRTTLFFPPGRTSLIRRSILSLPGGPYRETVHVSAGPTAHGLCLSHLFFASMVKSPHCVVLLGPYLLLTAQNIAGGPTLLYNFAIIRKGLPSSPLISSPSLPSFLSSLLVLSMSQPRTFSVFFGRDRAGCRFHSPPPRSDDCGQVPKQDYNSAKLSFPRRMPRRGPSYCHS